MASEQEREWYRRARLACFRKERWREFWTRHREQIVKEFPVRRERAALIDSLQSTVVLGIGPSVQPLLDPILEATA